MKTSLVAVVAALALAPTAGWAQMAQDSCQQRITEVASMIPDLGAGNQIPDTNMTGQAGGSMGTPPAGTTGTQGSTGSSMTGGTSSTGSTSASDVSDPHMKAALAALDAARLADDAGDQQGCMTMAAAAEDMIETRNGVNAPSGDKKSKSQGQKSGG